MAHPKQGRGQCRAPVGWFRRLWPFALLVSCLGGPVLGPTSGPVVRGQAANGLVAAAHPVAAQAGAELLARGGNAADAAIAASAALGVAEPFGSGLGGGGFLVAYDAASGAAFTVDCREMAPAAATPDMFIDGTTGKPYPRDTQTIGGLSVGAPGLARCWQELHDRAGRLPLADDLAPAIRAARDGFEVTPYFNGEITTGRKRLAAFPASAERYLPGGKPLPVGARLTQPDLAATLQLIADRGPDAFYTELAGEIATATASPTAAPGNGLTLVPGRLTLDDVLAYRAEVRDPVRGSYRGYALLTTPAPSAGPTLVETLNLLSGFDLAATGAETPMSMHLIAEAERVATADKFRWVGDPALLSVPCDGLVSPAFADQRRPLIAPDSTSTVSTTAGDPRPFGAGGCAASGGGSVPEPDRPVAVAAPDLDVDRAGTTHLSVVDGAGNAVAFTQTLALHFGSGITVPGRGFLLNDTLIDFRLDPSVEANINLPAPHQRPRSAIAPVLLLDAAGRLCFVGGAAGAVWITPVVTQLVVDTVDWQLPPQASIDAGRAIPENSRGGITFEGPFYDARPDLVAALRGLGHTVSRVNGERAAAQAIRRNPDTGQLIGGADRRRDGALDSGE